MTPEEQSDFDALIHGDVQGAGRRALNRLTEENAALRRDLKRAYELTSVALPPEASENLRSLLAKRVKDDAGLVAEESAILVDEALINDLLKLVKDEATRKLATMAAPRMVVETKGEAKGLLEMQQKQYSEQIAALREGYASAYTTLEMIYTLLDYPASLAAFQRRAEEAIVRIIKWQQNHPREL